jgi:ribosomal protein S18 acetylase RimI-like enzyme
MTERVLMSGTIALLSVEVGNELALNIYRKLGYRVIRTRPWVMAYP